MRKHTASDPLEHSTWIPFLRRQAFPLVPLYGIYTHAWQANCQKKLPISDILSDTNILEKRSYLKIWEFLNSFPDIKLQNHFLSKIVEKYFPIFKIRPFYWQNQDMWAWNPVITGRMPAASHIPISSSVYLKIPVCLIKNNN